MAAVVVLFGVFGSVIGSFLNVLIYRMPLRMSVVSPPSACPSCGHRIRGYDNVPVLSWFALRGRCRSCRNPISARYPAVELGTAAFFVVVAFRFGHPLTTDLRLDIAGVLALVAFLYLAAVTVTLALIDLDTRTLPNRIVLPSYLVGAALLGASGILDSDPGALLRALVGMAALAALYLALALVYPGGMGLGDVKLAGLLGLFLAWLGWAPLLVGAIAAFVLGGVFGLLLIVLRRAGRKSGIAFGPWMLLGGWVGILAGEPLAAGYLRLFGIG